MLLPDASVQPWYSASLIWARYFLYLQKLISFLLPAALVQKLSSVKVS